MQWEWEFPAYRLFVSQELLIYLILQWWQAWAYKKFVDRGEINVLLESWQESVEAEGQFRETFLK